MMVNPTYQNQSRLDTGTADVTMNTFRGEGRRGGGRSKNLEELMLIYTRPFEGPDFNSMNDKIWECTGYRNSGYGNFKISTQIQLDL